MLLPSRACSCGTHSARSPRCSPCSSPSLPRQPSPTARSTSTSSTSQPLSLEWPADGTLTDGYGPRWGRMHLGLDVGILRSLDVRAAAERHGHGRRLADRLRGLRQRRHGRHRPRLHAPLRASLGRAGRPGPVARRRRPGRPGGLHRLLHGHAPPLRAAQERRPDRPVSLSRVGPISPGRVMARPEAGATLRPAHDTDAPFAERARRPARLSRRRTSGLGTPGHRCASPDGLARQRHRHRPLRRVAR